MTVTEIISRHGKAACVLLRRSIDRMRFAEITLFGVSVAPVPLIMGNRIGPDNGGSPLISPTPVVRS